MILCAQCRCIRDTEENSRSEKSLLKNNYIEIISATVSQYDRTQWNRPNGTSINYFKNTKSDMQGYSYRHRNRKQNVRPTFQYPPYHIYAAWTTCHQNFSCLFAWCNGLFKSKFEACTSKWSPIALLSRTISLKSFTSLGIMGDRRTDVFLQALLVLYDQKICLNTDRKGAKERYILAQQRT